MSRLYEPGAFGRNNFALIRLILAAAVLYDHSFVLAVDRDNGNVLSNLIPDVTSLGQMALYSFMVLSGFLVTHSWHQSAVWWDFLRRRVLRIYPAFIMACLFAAFVAAPLGTPDPVGYFESIHFEPFASAVLQLGQLQIPPSFITNPIPGQVNGSLWTVKIEFECYVVLALLGIVGVLRRRTWVLAIFGAVLVINALRPVLPLRPDSFDSHLGLGTFFLAGTCAYLFQDRIPRSTTWLVVALLGLVCTGIMNVGFLELLPITGTYLLLYLAYLPPVKFGAIGSSTDLSYGLYLYAWPVQQLIVYASGGQIDPQWLAALAMIGACTLAWLSWRLIERPCLRWKGGRPGQRVAAPTAALPESPAPDPSLSPQIAVPVESRPRV